MPSMSASHTWIALAALVLAGCPGGPPPVSPSPGFDEVALRVRIARAEAWRAIRRGWSKHCPHCGRGALFIGWNKPHARCPVCGFLYERDYGDVWWVWIVTDRIPIGIGIVFLFFGFRVSSLWMGLVFFGSLALPLLLTIPRRYGLAIAITYLIRKRWPDPKDTFPALPG